jgi:hypothetical protein
LIQFTTSDEVLDGSSAPPARPRTITLTTTSPATQPMAKAEPVERARGVASMRMTAMIGTGLSATPTAEGRSPPTACQNIRRPYVPGNVA